MSFVRRAPTLVALAALSLSLAGPATASPTASGVPAWACSPEEIATAGAGSGAEARGGVDGQALVRDKDTGEVVRDLPEEAKGRAPSNFSVTVPVYLHVVTDGTAGAVTDTQIRTQISAINRGLQRRRGRGGHRLHVLARRRHPHQQRRLVSVPVGRRRARDEASAEAGWRNALNVYSTSGGALLGYAYLPEITDTAQAYLDGIVIDWQTCRAFRPTMRASPMRATRSPMRPATG